ncbi:EAL domain-containing protein [Paracraurococcus lichenis]|uniref:EAL domain-containing protein n=1 Tax=Paracraurococcus lichenis TaxID=3064888 RepID=A0ABT9DSD2_9PROT|nr:EAL domain-containing protein [Paracraurococcus sp. LOR1-02]MDO9706740.1 EAL domain-containing protein [Paracraurococcus sp. LOR1-02]
MSWQLYRIDTVHGSGAAAAQSRQVIVLARDPEVIAAAHAASARLGLPARTVLSGTEALARLAGPGTGPGHLVCDPAAAGAAWPGMLATLTEPATRTALILVGPAPMPVPRLAALVAHEPGQLVQALAAPPPQPAAADGSASALREGLARGEISVHYQPVVRLADRRPVMVEALARWHRAEAPVPPDSFVPLAEREGLARSLSIIVAGHAVSDMARLWPRLRLGVSLNLPLELMLEGDLQSWLGRALWHGGLAPRQVALELTETTPVRDLARLHRRLLRLRRAGYRVLLDDVIPGDGRERLHRLPFAGLKLDRSLVQRLPTEAQSRQEVRRLARRAAQRGQAVVAEGVSDQRIWRELRALGVHFAQGFAVGRPLPATALSGWSARWRCSRGA